MANETTANIDAIRGYIKKNDKKLIMQTLNSLDFFKDLSAGVMRNLLTDVHLNKMTVEAGVRPLNTTIEAEKSKRVWTRRTITPCFGMKIFNVIPEELRETFMSEMMAPGAKREPFAAWAWAREFEKLASEINDNFYNQEYKADAAAWASGTVYNSGDVVFFADDNIYYKANATTVAGESPSTTPAKWDDVDNQVMYDGPGTIIADEITATNITPVVTGALDNTNAYDKVMLVWDSIPEKDKNRKLELHCAFVVVEDIIAHHNTKFGSGNSIGGYDLDTNKPFILKGTANRLTIKPASWMAGSGRTVVIAPGNIKVGTNQNHEFNNVSKVVETLHGYKSVAKFALASQIADLESIWVNDQA